jgi:hypothetical protein
MATKEDLGQLIKSVLGLKRGTYLVIAPDADPRLIEGKPTLDRIYAMISTPERKCECCDTLTLHVAGAGKNPVVMTVDDTGMLDDLPVNALATYIARTLKNYPHEIHGTAVIVNDEDFE